MSTNNRDQMVFVLEEFLGNLGMKLLQGAELCEWLRVAFCWNQLGTWRQNEANTMASCKKGIWENPGIADPNLSAPVNLGDATLQN